MEEEQFDYDKVEQMTQDFLSSGESPTRQQLLETLNSADIPEEMKERLRESLGIAGYASGGAWLAVLLGALIFSVIFFFGYKLYKSIKDKELKKEEKKKIKQLKKKK